MKLVDANLLIYAYDRSSPRHEPARRWLQEAFSGTEPVRLAWVTLLAFLRITTHPRAFENPLAMGEAASFVDEWLVQPPVGILAPGERCWEILRRLLPAAQVRGPLVMDAYLAALAMEHGATLCTSDRDFTRFEGLNLFDPLAAAG